MIVVVFGLRLGLGVLTMDRSDDLSGGPDDHGRDQPRFDRFVEGKELSAQLASSPTTLDDAIAEMMTNSERKRVVLRNVLLVMLTLRSAGCV